MELSLTETEKIASFGQVLNFLFFSFFFGMVVALKHQSTIWGMPNLRCLLDIEVEMLSTFQGQSLNQET